MEYECAYVWAEEWSIQRGAPREWDVNEADWECTPCWLLHHLSATAPRPWPSRPPAPPFRSRGHQRPPALPIGQVRDRPERSAPRPQRGATVAPRPPHTRFSFFSSSLAGREGEGRCGTQAKPSQVGTPRPRGPTCDGIASALHPRKGGGRWHRLGHLGGGRTGSTGPRAAAAVARLRRQRPVLPVHGCAVTSPVERVRAVAPGPARTGNSKRG